MLLLDLGADATKEDIDGCQPWMSAALAGYEDLQKILEDKARAHQATSNVCEIGSDTVDLAWKDTAPGLEIQTCNNVSSRRNTRLHVAAKLGQVETIDRIMRANTKS